MSEQLTAVSKVPVLNITPADVIIVPVLSGIQGKIVSRGSLSEGGLISLQLFADS